MGSKIKEYVTRWKAGLGSVAWTMWFILFIKMCWTPVTFLDVFMFSYFSLMIPFPLAADRRSQSLHGCLPLSSTNSSLQSYSYFMPTKWGKELISAYCPHCFWTQLGQFVLTNLLLSSQLPPWLFHHCQIFVNAWTMPRLLILLSLSPVGFPSTGNGNIYTWRRE